MESIDHPDSHFRPTPGIPPAGGSAPPPNYYPAQQQPHLPATTPSADPGAGYDPRLTWKTGMLGIGYALGAIILLGVLFAIALGLGADQDSHTVNFFANLFQDLLLLGAAFLAVRGVVEHVTPETFGFRGLKWSGVGWAVLALVIFLIISAVYASLVTIEKENVEDSGLSGPLLAIFAIAIAPIVEEMFFRGFLFRAFRNGLGVIGAALFTGVLFGGVHAGSAPVEALPLLALFGVMLALLFEQTRSLWPCILLHTLYNSLVMVTVLAT